MNACTAESLDSACGRRYPRIPLDEDVRLAVPSVAEVRARVHDVSPDGFQVTCDRDTMRAIVPPGGLGPRAENRPAPVWAKLVLPLAGGEETIDAECRVSYVTLGEGTGFALGFEFLAMSPRSAQALQEFVEQSLVPVA
jgi:hypothetical protein